MKDLFKKIPSVAIFAALILLPMMFLFKTETDFLSFSAFKSLAAIPMSWDLDRVRNEVVTREAKYEEAFFNGSDPNGRFMRTQEAALAGLRARQYDLESEEILGRSLETYDPNDYKLENFYSNGNPTPRVYYDPNPPSSPTQNNTGPTNNNTGDPNDPYYGGYEQNLASQTGQEIPWDQKIQHTGVPFGGLITGRVDCTCDMPKYMIFLWDFTSNSLITLLVENPGKTKIWEVYTLNVGQYALGTHDPINVCKIAVGSSCLDYPTTGLINSGPGVGSSGIIPPSGLSFPSGISGGGPQNLMDGGTFPATYNF